MPEAMPPGPLAGIRVLDLTEYLAGPYCTAIFSDMGADVIKVERPDHGDSMRAWVRGNLRNHQFMSMNRNKRSLALSYKSAKGRQALLRLVAQADVFVENYRPGVLERAGIGYDTLRRHNPALIYCSISGYGYDGPWCHRGGFDLIAQAVGGLMHVTGEPDGPPTAMGQPVCDLGTALFAVSGILAALHRRNVAGIGQRVEVSLLETAVAFSTWSGADYLATGREPVRLGARHRHVAPYQRFRARDGYLVVTCAGQRLWERFCKALDREDLLADPRFADIPARNTNRAALERDIETVLGEDTVANWVARLDELGIPCGPILDYKGVFDLPQVRHRGMVVHCADEELGTAPYLRTPIRMTASDVAVRRTAPALGQHTEEVLREFGFSVPEIDGILAENAAFATAERQGALDTE